MLEEEEVEVPVSSEPPKESEKMDTEEATSESSKDVTMEEAKRSSHNAAGEVDNGVPESEQKSVQMEMDNKVCISIFAGLEACLVLQPKHFHAFFALKF